jgi:riboflavin biosynthesis pyrimidine reductase
MGGEPIIRWQINEERRYPFAVSPDPDWFEPIGFPPPWRDRPWIFGVMVASANGVVAWRRSDLADDPVLSVLGGDPTRPARIADLRHMRHLRCYGDVAIGAQTLREQPRLVQIPQEPTDPPMPALYAFRHAHGLPREPRHVIYSLGGCLDVALPVFNTAGVEAIVVTTGKGDAELRACGVPGPQVQIVVDALENPGGLHRAHQRLFAERGVRYLDCEGGQTMLTALRGADLLDEVFVTQTDVTIDVSRHAGVLRIFDFEREGAALIAEGHIAEDPGWTFRRWRFNRA